MKTYTPKPSEIQRDWYVVDAEGMILGRMATEVASVLRGKHKPIFAPHVDTGDHVIVINADKVLMSGNSKAADKRVYRHSGYPGGLKSRSYADLLDRKPAEAVRGTIRGMLPKGPLGRKQGKKLKVYAGPEHPHAAQSPQTFTVAASGAGARRQENQD
jgi:large subunit ribosomal protein L13